MVYEWGRLPNKGELEEVSDTYEVQVGDLIYSKLIYGAPAEMENPPTEAQIVDRVIREIRAAGHQPTYIRVKRNPPYSGGIPYWTYEVNNLTYIKHASPLAPIVVAAIIIAVMVAFTVTIVVLAPVIWKWAGLTPEEVQQYLSPIAGLGAEAIILVALILGILFLIMSWKKK